MAKLKSFDEFCNESLVLSADYNYYGPGSLVPLIQQLVREGKDSSIIRSYLTSLGVEAWRIDKAFESFGSEVEITIGEKKKVNESELNEKVLKSEKDKVKAAENGADVFVDDTVVDFIDSFPAKDWKKKVKEHKPDNASLNASGLNPKEIVFALADPNSGDVSFSPANYVEVVESKKVEVKKTFEENATKFLSDINEEEEPKNASFESAATAFLLDLPGADEVSEEKEESKVEEKLNKETLTIEADGEDIDDMIDDLEDGDEDTYQGDDDNAPDGKESPEQKIKDGESPADAVEGDDSDNSSATDKLANAAKELAKDSKKLEKIKKLLAEKKKNETETITIDDDGEEVKDKEGIEDAETGDEVDIEEPAEENVKETFGQNIPEDGEKSEKDFQDKQAKLTNEEDTWKPQPGLFMLPATSISKIILESSDNVEQAITRFDTHSEKVKPLLGKSDIQNLEMAKVLLEKKQA